jgi:hypothetical protein
VQINFEQSTSGQTIVAEFDALTDETTNAVWKIIAKPFEVNVNGGITYDWAATYQAVMNFWDPSPWDKSEEATWGKLGRSPNLATHNGKQGELGQWIVGLFWDRNSLLCHLAVRHQQAGQFSPVIQHTVPCTINFTHLTWADVTNDGQNELLLLTLPPNVQGRETGAGMQRLYIYTLGQDVAELATLEGAFNGPDGAGIRWKDIDGDGKLEILAGLPFVDLNDSKLPENLDRRFRVYRWNATTHKFVAGEIWVEPK